MARPKLPEGQGKRHPLNVRTTADIRARLDAAASTSGRSLAQEVERRLEQSFEREDLEVTLRRVLSEVDGVSPYYKALAKLAKPGAVISRETVDRIAAGNALIATTQRRYAGSDA